ncbi:hypothetical protein GGD62_007105 [Bradyrhizobium sp. ERR14]|nr:hypothetical protein [Bradyrhizobium sp. ERR14]
MPRQRPLASSGYPYNLIKGAKIAVAQRRVQA